VSEAVLEHRAVLGGEGNGSVIIPEIQAVPDSTAAIGLFMEHMALTGHPLSVLAGQLPEQKAEQKRCCSWDLLICRFFFPSIREVIWNLHGDPVCENILLRGGFAHIDPNIQGVQLPLFALLAYPAEPVISR
jgi:hypothetical protein